MAMRNISKTGAARRVTRHRRKLAAAGGKRLEIVVPREDAALLRHAAAQLRAGGDSARRIRHALGKLTMSGSAASGAELVAFLRASPLVGVELNLERDLSPGRHVDI